MNGLAISGCCKKRKERIGLEKGEAFVKALKNATPSTINFNYATPIFLLFCNVILIQSLKYCVRHWRTLSIFVVGFSHVFFFFHEFYLLCHLIPTVLNGLASIHLDFMENR